MGDSRHTNIFPNSTRWHHCLGFRFKRRLGTSNSENHNKWGSLIVRQPFASNIYCQSYSVLFLTLPQGKSVADSLSSRFEILQTTRGQVTAGLQIITFFGFAVSAQTFWISSKISEGASFCSSTTVFSCDDLLGNRDLNIDPLFGISWGLLECLPLQGYYS